MPGGRYDSSKTRVAPFFDHLLERDPTGADWLGPLLALPEYGSGRASVPASLGELHDHAWGDSERALDPPASLLRWLVRNLKCPSSMKRDQLRPERRDLIDGDADRIEEGVRLLDDGPGGRSWSVMEGPSYPDAYLATSDAVIVIEGKRTERGPTTATTWMPVRLQMLRHLDAAFEIAGPRTLLGFFMVEGPADGSLPEVWREACAQTLDPELLERSLPHRSPEERQWIAEAFLGAVTWQRAAEVLGLPDGVLPDEV
ncbi:MAG TPA: hypothetical protein VKA74_10725 [Myxococcota bacterium]|nr:hypothetical protein [Myxococcota bacterium]